MKLEFKTPQFLVSLFLTLFVVIVSSVYIFFIKQEYSFIVEGDCLLNDNTCFSRDCSEEGSCYEYQAEVYSLYNIPASEFKKCNSDIFCANKCVSGEIMCTQIECDTATEECYDQNSQTDGDAQKTSEETAS